MEVLPISKQELQINEQIRDKELRVIDSDGNQLGIMSLRQALEIADGTSSHAYIFSIGST